jgi:hypothetical protein
VKVGELDAGLDWLQQALSEAESLTDRKARHFIVTEFMIVSLT